MCSLQGADGKKGDKGEPVCLYSSYSVSSLSGSIVAVSDQFFLFLTMSHIYNLA